MRLRAIVLAGLGMFALFYLVWVSALIIGNGVACGVVGCLP